MKEIVDQISARLRDQGIDVPEEEIMDRLKILVENFRVPEAEARRSILNYFYKEHGVTPARVTSEPAKVADISEPGRWVDLEVRILQLWEPTSPSISQTGLVGDDTGKIKFVKWSRDNLPEMVEGKSYRLKKVVTDEFQGRFGIRLNRFSRIEELDREIEAQAMLAGPAEEVRITDIYASGRWVDLKAKVVQLWESNSETISQVGLIGDETGSMRFVKWAKADLPDLVEGRSYLLKNVVTDEFQGRFNVKLNRTSQIIPLEEDLDVGSQSSEFTGAVVDIQKGSGLIKRCPTCRRSLAKGICGEHGKVEGIYDLRIKAVLDDGSRVQDVLINRERTESLIGLTLDEARQMAMEALDHEVIRGRMEEMLVGRYYAVTGPRIDRYILVETMSKAPPVDAKDVDELLHAVEVV